VLVRVCLAASVLLGVVRLAGSTRRGAEVAGVDLVPGWVSPGLLVVRVGRLEFRVGSWESAVCCAEISPCVPKLAPEIKYVISVETNEPCIAADLPKICRGPKLMRTSWLPRAPCGQFAAPRFRPMLFMALWKRPQISLVKIPSKLVVGVNIAKNLSDKGSCREFW
jgi:hypothetical protein